MRERIAPGFFDAALKESPDVRLLFNHDPNFLLGRTTSGTLKLESDSIGLKIEATPPASGTLRDMVIAPMERGDLTGASFSFTLQPNGDTWAKASDGIWERTLKSAAELFDVGPVAFPFYPDTSLALRSLEGFREAEERKTSQKIQTLIFDKTKSPSDVNSGNGWTVAEAKAWAGGHDFKSDKVDEPAGRDTIRLRQFDPATCKEGTFETLTTNFPVGIQAVACGVQESNSAALDQIRRDLDRIRLVSLG